MFCRIILISGPEITKALVATGRARWCRPSSKAGMSQASSESMVMKPVTVAGGVESGSSRPSGGGATPNW